MIQAPPECVTYEQRNEAQQVFIDFQKTKCPFDLCKEILETTQIPFVQFQAGCCLKNGVIRDWQSLSTEQRQILLSYLNEFVNNKPVESYVREVLLLVCAIILKRIAIDEGNDSVTLSEILNFLFETLSNATLRSDLRIIACSSILSLLNEYSSSTRASDFGLPWITHLRAKKKFENTHLKSIFRCVLESLITHLKIKEENRNADWLILTNKLLQISEFILSWNFDVITIFSSQYAKHVDSIENPSLQPAIDWKEVLIDGNVISIYFEIHHCIRNLNDQQMVHSSLQCLSQLSSLNGNIIMNSDNRKKFIEAMLNGANNLISSICDSIASYEVVSLTSIINRICLRLQSRDQIAYVQNESLKSFFESMARLTCKLIYDSLNSTDEETFDQYKLAIDNMLNSWMIVISKVERLCEERREEAQYNTGPSPPKQQEVLEIQSLAIWTRPIFEVYLRAHLTCPEGLKNNVAQQEEDIQEFQDDDIIIFIEQLNAIGSLARIDPSHSFNCLLQILTIRINQLQNCLQHENCKDEKLVEWTNLNEDIHWLVMISFSVLTQPHMGERELIPNQIMSMSIDAAADLNQTVSALQNFDPSNQNIDPVVRLIIFILKLCQMEKYLLQNSMTHIISPQVSLSLTVFISKFASSYLLPCESDYTEMSMTLNSCFGRDSLYASQILNFIVDHIIAKIIYWPSENQLTEESSNTLVYFVRNCSERSKALNNCESMNKLLVKHKANEFHNLSVITRKNIYQIFIYIASYKNQLYEEIFLPLRRNYQLLQTQINHGQNNEEIRITLIELCECLEGICNGTIATNVTSIWSNISFILNDLEKLLMYFHNFNLVVLSILQLLSQIASRVLYLLNEADSIIFYNTSIAVLNQYAKHNRGLLTKDQSNEEDSYNDILIIMNFLNDLAAKDFIEWYPPLSQTHNDNSYVSASQVVFVGLNIIMPLMNAQLLEFPKLCQSYYKLISYLCEDPDRLQGLPDQLMESIMQSIELALKST